MIDAKNFKNGDFIEYAKIVMSTLNAKNLELKIEIGGFDLSGNQVDSIFIFYQLDAIRNVNPDEMEQIANNYFKKLIV